MLLARHARLLALSDALALLAYLLALSPATRRGFFEFARRLWVPFARGRRSYGGAARRPHDKAAKREDRDGRLLSCVIKKPEKFTTSLTVTLK